MPNYRKEISRPLCPKCLRNDKVWIGGKSKKGSSRWLCGRCNKKFQDNGYSVRGMEVTPAQERDNATILALKKQIMDLTQRKKIVSHKFFEDRIRIGVIADTHLNSLYERLDILEAAYDTFQSEGITQVYHAGDVVDGEKMHVGHEYEIHTAGADQQVNRVKNIYPIRDGIDTHFITGSHDLSFWKRSGTDIGPKMDIPEKNLHYLGRESVDIDIKTGKGNAIMRLLHPGKGSAYALSYQPQKYIDALSGGQKPHIVIMGHYHKAEMLPTYRNVFLIQAGCLQSQTPWMARLGLAAHLGFWILDFTVDVPNLISRFKAEFFAVYEESKFIRKED